MSVFPQVAQAYNVGLSVTFHDWKGAASRMGFLTLAHSQPSLCKSVSGKAGETDKPVKNYLI